MANHAEFDAFVETIAKLRAPDGCPWDREQTHASIAHNMIEEAYEAVDAIEARDVAHLREELGDVLLQVVLQSQIAADAGEFTIDDVWRYQRENGAPPSAYFRGSAGFDARRSGRYLGCCENARTQGHDGRDG